MKRVTLVKRALLGVGVIAVLFVATGLAGPWYRQWQDDRALAALAADPHTASAAAAIKRGHAARTANPNDSSAYIDEGLGWKSAGEFTGNRLYVSRARDVYEAGFALFQEKNSIIALNAANVNADLGDNARAEFYYKALIKNDMGYQEGYVGYIEFLKKKKKAPTEEIVKVYEEGLKNLIENGVLFQDFGLYLYSHGDYQRAIPFLQILADRYPNENYDRYLEDARAKVRE